MKCVTSIKEGNIPSTRRTRTLRRIPAKAQTPADRVLHTGPFLRPEDTGLCVESEVLRGEERGYFDQLVAGYYELFAPVTLELRAYLDDLTHCELMLRRLLSPDNPLPADVRQEWIEAIRRSYNRLLREARKSHARFVPAPDAPESPAPTVH